MPVKFFTSPDIETKDVGTDGIVGTVTLYASAFGNVDLDGDVIEKGAFRKTLKERGPGGSNQILHLLNHDTRQVVGKPSEIKEDDFGLRAVTPIPDTTIGSDLYKLYKLKVYNEHSIGFRVMNSVPLTENGKTVNVLKELKLWEYSTVPWGANPNTPVVHLKSETKSEQLDEVAERLDRINKAITDNHFSEKTVTLLQIEIQYLTDCIKSINTVAPGDDLTPEPEPFDPAAFLKGYDIGMNLTKFFTLK